MVDSTCESEMNLLLSIPPVELTFVARLRVNWPRGRWRLQDDFPAILLRHTIANRNTVFPPFRLVYRHSIATLIQRIFFALRSFFLLLDLLQLPSLSHLFSPSRRRRIFLPSPHVVTTMAAGVVSLCPFNQFIFENNREGA